jgi:pyridoxamine 5'-phosphate oxidase
MTKISDLRKEYTQAGLNENDLDINPLQQFLHWFKEAQEADILEPNAMTLATINGEGKPSARIVLLKDINDRGFAFFTNYESQKGQELIANPYAALVFLWGELERQVRIEGQVEKVSNEESDNYFYNRPIGSQLGAWASNQSSIIDSREILVEKLKSLEVEYEDKVIPRPAHWGGFRLIPTEIEFWQGRPNRLHDRFRYQLQSSGEWAIDRLAP